ncbi:hypothetical protein ACO0SA_003576 [Hanseniaspora valbyensis]
MAKSLRAKSSHKAKRFRRHNLEYQSVVDKRAERITEKAIENYIKNQIKLARQNGDTTSTDEELKSQFEVKAADLYKKKVAEKDTDGDLNMNEATDKQDEDNKDNKEDIKVSTSGWRDARHLNYRRAKKEKSSKKKGSFMKF